MLSISSHVEIVRLDRTELRHRISLAVMLFGLVCLLLGSVMRDWPFLAQLIVGWVMFATVLTWIKKLLDKVQVYSPSKMRESNGP